VRLKGEGRKNKDIVVMFENDPYVKASKILELIDKAEDKRLIQSRNKKQGESYCWGRKTQLLIYLRLSNSSQRFFSREWNKSSKNKNN
jgi:hypothetical protein